MDVEILHDAPVAVSALSTKTYPKGWRGSVDDVLGREMVAKGFAIDLSAPPAAAEAPSISTPATTPEPDVALDEMKLPALREIALALGIDGVPALKRPALIAAIEAARAAASAGMPTAGDDRAD